MSLPKPYPDLNFTVQGAQAVPYAASPLLALQLQLTSTSDISIHSVLLRCQIRIEVSRRGYTSDEQLGLYDLFGRPEEWGRSLRALLWTQANVSVPGFAGSTSVELPIHCTYDFDLATTKYFDALKSGDVPLCLLFSGTVFYSIAEGPLQVAQIPWEKEATYRLPLAVWRGVMDHYYPNTAWVRLQKDVFDRLHRYKREHGLPTWEQAVTRLLAASELRPAANSRPAGGAQPCV
jgi:hypothetical protein